MKKICLGLAVVAGISVGGVAQAVDAARAKKMAQDSGCTNCHPLDKKKLVGPGFQLIAEKYAGAKDVLPKLVAKVKNGGGGVWGPIEMTANKNVPDADIKTIVEWILSLK